MPDLSAEQQQAQEQLQAEALVALRKARTFILVTSPQGPGSDEFEMHFFNACCGGFLIATTLEMQAAIQRGMEHGLDPGDGWMGPVGG